MLRERFVEDFNVMIIKLNVTQIKRDVRLIFINSR